MNLSYLFKRAITVSYDPELRSLYVVANDLNALS